MLSIFVSVGYVIVVYRIDFQDNNRDVRMIWSEFRLNSFYPSTGHVISDQNNPARELKWEQND